MGNRSSNAGVVGIGELDQQEILKEVVKCMNLTYISEDYANIGASCIHVHSCFI